MVPSLTDTFKSASFLYVNIYVLVAHVDYKLQYCPSATER